MRVDLAPATYLLWVCVGAPLGIDDAHPPSRKRRPRRRVLLNEEDRFAVDEAIRLHCEQYDLWLGALSVQEDHVECVIRDPAAVPKKIIQRLKAIATRALRYEHPDKFAGRVWRAGARVERLETEDAISDALQRVLECDKAEDDVPEPADEQ